MNSPFFRFFIASLFSVFIAAPTRSQISIPPSINYQGRLANADGSVSPDGSGYEIETRLWSAQANGSLLWATRFSGVTVKAGAFSLILGSASGSAIPGAASADLQQVFTTSPAVFLGLTVTKNAAGTAVGTPTEILPRQQLLPVPTTFFAATAGAAQTATKADNGVPPGTVLPFAGSLAPAGYLLCDGSTVSRTAYPALFAAIGINWGTGTGSGSDFSLPDIRSRFLLGAGQGAGLTNRVPAQKGGEETHRLTISEMPSHTHAIGVNDKTSGENGANPLVPESVRVTNKTTNATTAEGGGLPHNIMPPFAVVNYIIKY